MAFRISEYRDSSFNDVDGSGVWEIDTVVYCDTIADLPNKDDIAHYKLVMGCRAIIINTGDTYILNSSGDWKKDTSGSSGGGGGGGSTITIDDVVSAASENPVQNKAIYNFVVDEISDKADKSTTLSGYGIADATINTSTGVIQLGTTSITPVRTIEVGGVSQTNSNGTVNLPAYPTVPTVDSSMIADSTNPVQSKVIQSALDEKPGDVTGTYNYSGTVLTNDIFNDLLNNIAENGSHAEGKGTTASGIFSHTEGIGTIVSAAIGGATPIAGHAEGDRAEAHGNGSHAEGILTVANDYATHAEGYETAANAQYSHAEGLGTMASSQHQHVQGKYNVADMSHKYAFIIGNGTSKSARSNAFAIDWAGNIYIGNTSTGINITALTPTSSYSSTGTSPVNGAAVSMALQTLDSAQVGGDGKLIQSISEADGIISATAIDIASTYSSASTSPVNGAAISDALGTLDVSSVGGSGSYIESISETNGKISATMQAMDTAPTSDSEHAITSGAVYTALVDKVTILDVYGLGTTIESGTDLDSLTSVGVYNCLTNQIATTLSNCPTVNGFRLEVVSTISTTSYKIQRLYPNNSNGEFFIRRQLSSGWSGWTRFAADTSAYQVGTSLVSGDDLNDYMTVGRYYAGTSISGSILNKPVVSAYGFELTVEQNATTSRLIQTITYNTSNPLHFGQIYKRWYTLDGWSRWFTFSPQIDTITGGSYIALGDSIVEYQGTTADPKYQTSGVRIKGYIQAIEMFYGVVCTNNGHAGHTLVQDISELLTIDYSNADIVTIGYGVNDARLDVVLGTRTDTSATTFAGAMNQLLQKIFTDNAMCRVVVLSPIQRAYVNNFGSYTPNSNGDTLEDFVEMCKSVANYNGVPCIDLFHNCGINSSNTDETLIDGVHPLNSGYKRMWQIMKPVIAGLVTGEIENA